MTHCRRHTPPNKRSHAYEIKTEADLQLFRDRMAYRLRDLQKLQETNSPNFLVSLLAGRSSLIKNLERNAGNTEISQLMQRELDFAESALKSFSEAQILKCSQQLTESAEETRGMHLQEVAEFLRKKYPLA